MLNTRGEYGPADGNALLFIVEIQRILHALLIVAAIEGFPLKYRVFALESVIESEQSGFRYLKPESATSPRC